MVRIFNWSGVNCFNIKKLKMKVKIKKLVPEGVIPRYSKPGDAGLDLIAIGVDYNNPLYVEYNTGLSVEIPYGYVGLIFPRSSVSGIEMILSNCVGVIDSGYRGEIKLRFKVLGTESDALEPIIYRRGDKVGQLIIIPYPQIELEEVEELSETVRGEGGFGSTGK